MDFGCGSEKLSKDEVLSRFSERSVLEGRSPIPFSRSEAIPRTQSAPTLRHQAKQSLEQRSSCR